MPQPGRVWYLVAIPCGVVGAALAYYCLRRSRPYSSQKAALMELRDMLALRYAFDRHLGLDIGGTMAKVAAG